MESDMHIDQITHSRLFQATTLTLAASSLLLAVGCGANKNHTPPDQDQAIQYTEGSIDLIRGRHWQQDGVQSSNNQLHVTATSQRIVKQDGSAGQENPQANLYGISLKTHDGFTLHTHVKDVTGAASISVYPEAPITEDEYRVDRGTVTVTLNGNSAEASLVDQTDGSHERSTAMITDTTEHDLTITDSDGTVTVNIDGQKLTAFSDHDEFDEGTAYIGLATPRGSFNVDTMTAAGYDGGEVAAYDTRDSWRVKQLKGGFADLATQKRPGFFFGASVSTQSWSDPQLRNILGNYNAITTENEAKWQTIHPRPGNDPSDYNFTNTDALVEAATKSGMDVHLHTLVFGEANPDYLQKVAESDPAALKQMLIDHITTVVSRYKGKLKSIDVINEPLADYDTAAGELGLRQNMWYRALGKDYLVTAIKAVRAADPNVEIGINEFGLEGDEDRANQMAAVLQYLKSQGAAADYVGMQAHLTDGDYDDQGKIDTDQLNTNIGIIARTGVRVRISELDVDNSEAYPAIGQVVSTCIANIHCDGVTLWGISDAYSSAGAFDNAIYQTGIGLPWDANNRPLSPVADIKKAISHAPKLK